MTTSTEKVEWVVQLYHAPVSWTHYCTYQDEQVANSVAAQLEEAQFHCQIIKRTTTVKEEVVRGKPRWNM